ncbi:uncharacterized protein LOC141852411 isoform X2 [Brevipalpus obovatus]|uniref:uncharacterized protein LOC141852411 isoform X2 n=1 Tax=Brevipalpus obovatus TaxID=246614 RepID=UPI003D9E4DA6
MASKYRNSMKSKAPSTSTTSSSNTTSSSSNTSSGNNHNDQGVYRDYAIMAATTSLTGAIVRVVCKDGNIYEGVLATFSPEYDLAINMVIKIDPDTPGAGQNMNGLLASLRKQFECTPTIVFNFHDIVALSVLSIDLDYASKGHFTDTEISRFDSSNLNQRRDLVPWDGGAEEGLTLEDDATSKKGSSNGWAADDMFKMNEEKYQVKTTFDENLYTVPLVKQDTEEYRKREAEASRIASEVENDKASSERTAKEDGDEEEKYSAVIRPVSEPQHPISHGNHRQPIPQRRKPPPSQISGPNNGPRGKGPQNNNPPSVSSANTHSKYHSHSYSDVIKESHKSTPQLEISFGSLAFNREKSSPHGPMETDYRQSHRSQRVNPDIRQQQHQSQHQSQQAQQQQQQPQQQQPAPQQQHQHHQSHQPQAQHFIREQAGNQNQPTQHHHRVQHGQSKSVSFSRQPQKSIKKDSRVETSEIKRETSVSSSPVTTPTASSSPGVSVTGPMAPPPGPPVVVSAPPAGVSAPPPQPAVSVPATTSSIIAPSSATAQSASSTAVVSSVPATNSPSTSSETPSKPDLDSETEKIVKKSTLNPYAKEFNPSVKPFTPRPSYSSGHPTPAATPTALISPMASANLVHNHNHVHSHGQVMHSQNVPTRVQNQMVLPGAYHQASHFMPSLGPFAVPPFMLSHNMQTTSPFQANNNPQNLRPYKKNNSQQYQNQNSRHDFSQAPATVAAATGHPVLAGSPMQAPYPGQHQSFVAAPSGTPQQLYPSGLYMGHPRTINVIPHTGVMPQLQYDVPQPFYMTPMLQPHIMTQVAQQTMNLPGAGQMSAGSTPQSVTPNTPFQGGPAPSPVHHPGQVPNQPPTPTPGQAVIYLTQQPPSKVQIM